MEESWLSILMWFFLGFAVGAIAFDNIDRAYLFMGMALAIACLRILSEPIDEEDKKFNKRLRNMFKKIKVFKKIKKYWRNIE